MQNNKVTPQQGGNQKQCPQGCCDGNEILCVSIPCPVQVVLLGIELKLKLPCLSLTSNQNLTNDQIQQLLGVLRDLLGSVGNIGGLASQGVQLNVKNKED